MIFEGKLDIRYLNNGLFKVESWWTLNIQLYQDKEKLPKLEIVCKYDTHKAQCLRVFSISTSFDATVCQCRKCFIHSFYNIARRIYSATIK